MLRPLILTARMDQASQRYFDDLRKRHFPPERNYLAAHLTLFHALPGSQIDAIHSRLSNLASNHPVIHGRVVGLRSLGRGVAFSLECAQLSAARAALADSWQHLLTPQDSHSWRPHITIQNKVTPEAARALLQQLQPEVECKQIQFTGFDLWHYDGGPWSLARSYTLGLFAAL